MGSVNSAHRSLCPRASARVDHRLGPGPGDERYGLTGLGRRAVTVLDEREAIEALFRDAPGAAEGRR
jgi:hypothetical protein